MPTELAATAKHMVSSGMFKTAVVGVGGLSGTFVDGTQAVLFADRPEEQDGGYGADARHRAPTATTRLTGISGASTKHEIAYFVDTSDTGGAFTPARQDDFAAAWTKAYGASLAGDYESDAIPVTLENIIALGNNHPIEFLSLSTHGFVAYVAKGSQALEYVNLSDPKITAASTATYAPQIAAGTVMPAIVLDKDGGTSSGATRSRPNSSRRTSPSTPARTSITNRATANTGRRLPAF